MNIAKKLSVLTTGAVVIAFGTISNAQAITLIGLTDNNTLVSFDSSSPSITSNVPVSGVNGNLVGIDFRPANNLLYGVSVNNQIFTINPTTGAATSVGTLSVPFNGGFQSGLDFNPVVDRLRLVGSNDQNLRINVDNGVTIADTPLAYAPGDVNAPSNPNIVAAAYINSIQGATSTTLYDIDSSLDILATQNPANSGILNTVGSLGIDFGPTGGFDIFRDANGGNTAFAATTLGGASDSTLYTINLSTGAATLVGAIGDNNPTNIIGLAAQPVPFEFSPGLTILALGACTGIAQLRSKVQKWKFSGSTSSHK